MYQELAEHYMGNLGAYQPKAPITDRKAWESLDEEYKNTCIREAEKVTGFLFPAILATDYMRFLRTGNRVEFENVYFKKRNVLNILVLAECVENKGRFLDDIMNGIFSLCEESGWQLPPHNSYFRSQPQFPLPDATEPVLDLFSCETGAQLAVVYYLVGASLEQVSPFIGKRILAELEFRIIKPYLQKHFWWMGNGDEPMCNWTIWCTQNILLTAFLTPQEETIKKAVFKKAAQSVDYFLKDYGEDGCCDEGAQYYRRSGLCLFLATEILNAVSENAFLNVYQQEKIKNIASYIFKVHIGDKYYVNFADCSPVAGRAGAREYLFAKRTGNEQMMKYAARDYAASVRESEGIDWYSDNGINLSYHLLTAFTLKEMKEQDVTEPLQHPDVYFESVGVFLTSDSTFALAVKAGDNDDSHNHNDTGSITVYKNNQPFLIDIGVESYTRKTFSPQRYEIWTMQSAYHNLPTFHGVMQKDGAAYCAKEVKTTLGTKRSEISMNLKNAYPAESHISSYTRRAVLEKENEIYLRDEFTFDSAENSEVMESFITYEQPEIVSGCKEMQTDLACQKMQSPGSSILKETIFYGVCEPENELEIAVGQLGTMKFTGAVEVMVEQIAMTDPRLMTAWKHDIYRILIKTGGKQTCFDMHLR